ncbi:MAG TPA: ferritin-like domain-containing protein [Caulobacterales bacterium]|nr:ferritin-like domain-containing protein [Caulobacterales bacterium]
MSEPALLSPSREQLVHTLYEAAELEHNLMCTYLYAAFSLKDGEAEGLSSVEAEAVARWRREILDVAIEEMGHLTAVWNITAALGGAPHFGRDNFPLSPGRLPASVVVKLAPFNEAVLQHFVFLERPHKSTEPDGEGFAPELEFRRGVAGKRLTPMPLDYETVGDFYAALSDGLRSLVETIGEKSAFCGDPGLQLSPAEIDLNGAKTVICAKTALAAFDAIVRQGEGAPADSTDSHFQKFIAVREEYRALKARNPDFAPAFPAAHNPVLRRPPDPHGRVWLEDGEAIATVDLANAAYGLMLRLLAYAYAISGPSREKALAVDLGVELMRAVYVLGERAARLPAGPSNPDCNAGVSFVALRDAAALPPGESTRRFFVERLGQLAEAAEALAASGEDRAVKAARVMASIRERAVRGFSAAATEAPAPAVQPAAAPAPATHTLINTIENGVEIVQGEKLAIHYRGKRCIHTRWCVTGAPKVFLANVEGPWIHPDEMDVEELAGIARDCPSGAVQYVRNDGMPEEAAPPVNLVRVYEGGPYAVRADIRLNGEAIGYRATLCRCGQSKNKPFCDGSHHDAHFDATGEPPTGDKTAMLPVRDGQLEINPQIDGPLMVRGNFEIMSGTGRMIARVTACRLCRCGHSNTKPFCDGTHAKIGFKSE